MYLICLSCPLFVLRTCPSHYYGCPILGSRNTAQDCVVSVRARGCVLKVNRVHNNNNIRRDEANYGAVGPDARVSLSLQPWHAALRTSDIKIAGPGWSGAQCTLYVRKAITVWKERSSLLLKKDCTADRAKFHAIERTPAAPRRRCVTTIIVKLLTGGTYDYIGIHNTTYYIINDNVHNMYVDV